MLNQLVAIVVKFFCDKFKIVENECDDEWFVEN
jgi:hypothetical protein